MYTRVFKCMHVTVWLYFIVSMLNFFAKINCSENFFFDGQLANRISFTFRLYSPRHPAHAQTQAHTYITHTHIHTHTHTYSHSHTYSNSHSHT